MAVAVPDQHHVHLGCDHRGMAMLVSTVTCEQTSLPHPFDTVVLHFTPEGWGFLAVAAGEPVRVGAHLRQSLFKSGDKFYCSADGFTYWLHKRAAEHTVGSLDQSHWWTKFTLPIAGAQHFFTLANWQEHKRVAKTNDAEVEAYRAELANDDELATFSAALRHSGKKGKAAAAAASSGSSSSGGPKVGKLPKVFTPEELDMLLPDVTGCYSFHEKAVNRLRVFYVSETGLRDSKSRSLASTDTHAACLALAGWAWVRHANLTGIECPWPEVAAAGLIVS